MAYTEVPVDANEAFSVSQPKIKENFSLIDTAFAKNHGKYNTTDVGKHFFITFPLQVTTPGSFPLVTSTTETAFYCKTDGTNPAIYIRNANKAVGVATDDFKLTPSIAGHATYGYEVLPSGLKICWGNGLISATSKTSAAQTFAGGGFTDTPYSVQITPYGSPTGVSQDYVVNAISLTNVQFNVTRTDAHKSTECTYRYLAIGK